MTEGKKFLTVKEFALKTNYTERQIRQYCVEGRIEGAEKFDDKARKWLIPESSVIKTKLDAETTHNTTAITNWIEEWINQYGEPPLIPVWMLPIVKDKTMKRISKNMVLSIPSSQWWNGLLSSQREMVLQTIEWLGQNRQDYLEMINKLIPGQLNDIRLQWKR